MTSASNATRTELHGIAAAPGRVVAPAWRWELPQVHDVAVIDLTGEPGITRLEVAVREVKAALTSKASRLEASGATSEAGILEAQALMLDDPALLDRASQLIREGKPADLAVKDAMAPFAEMLRASEDAVFQARAADLDDVVEQLQRKLHGVSDVPPAPEQPSIVIARDLAPSQTAGLDRALVVGFATEQGTATAHTAILARALGLPAVVGIAGLLESVADGQAILLDGDAGTLITDPPAEVVARVARPAAMLADERPAITRDNRRIEVACNAANIDDANRAAIAGADGIGLLRSEFLFLGHSRLPSEDEQVAMLEQVMAAMGDRPVILRTLDVGADKPLPALPQPPEANPALGVRGLRLHLLRRPDLLMVQLRAALRVATRHPLRLMFPMVSTIDEVREAKALVANAARDLHADASRIEVGIMVEVPAAAVTSDLLAREVDFFSLGTNDLTQYLFAADRTNPELGALADSLHPALLRLVDQVMSAARAHDRWVGVCGEMASDLASVPLLVGLGLDELSVHPPLVERVKGLIRQLRADQCQRIAEQALQLESAVQVRELLRREGLDSVGLRQLATERNR